MATSRPGERDFRSGRLFAGSAHGQGYQNRSQDEGNGVGCLCGGNVDVLESTVAWIQIHDSRMRQLVRDNNDASNTRVVTRTEIGNRMVNAASIYAGASSFFNYARRRDSNFPVTVSWDEVSAALRQMRHWPDEN